LEIIPRISSPTKWEDLPVAIDHETIFNEWINVGAILLREIRHNVVDINEIITISPQLTVHKHYYVMACLGTLLCFLFGSQLRDEYVVRSYRNTGLFPKLTQQIFQFGIRACDKMVPSKNRYFTSLSQGRQG